ncbi:MAG TPA: cysteine desulfurase family protein [Aggregatilineales bacterium]|nr:cysteine desulfurase family protein [Aggregatilineales bacterium]
MSHIYLDHSATTPLDPRVLEAMIPYFVEDYGNASSDHSFGRSAEAAVEKARRTIAGILNCKPTEIVFTSGGSESDNLAVRGAAWAGRVKNGANHLITTPIEHGAIGKTVDQLVKLQGFEHSLLPVDEFGRVSPDDLAKACRAETSLASVIYANNEVGTIEPIAELAAAAHERGVLFHTDAVQAAGQLPLDVQKLGVDLLSISAHKFYGPKGVGALYVRDGLELVTAQTGGGQERGRRAGTYNTPAIVGLARALELAYATLAERTAHYRTLRDHLIEGILTANPQARLSGHPEQRLPSHASFVFDGLNSGPLLDYLDLNGIAASAASACKAGSAEPSSVLLALGYSRKLASCSLRLTVGLQTTAEAIDTAIGVVTAGVHKYSQTAPALAVS